MSRDASGLQAALAGEHAAIYGYGDLGGHLTGTPQAAARTALARHRAQRNDTIALLLDWGVQPDAPASAYSLPPLTGMTAVLTCAATIEERLQRLWREALAVDDGAARQLALAGLSHATQQALEWRRRLGSTPAPPAFPGFEGGPLPR
jgi:hypothetical protein